LRRRRHRHGGVFELSVRKVIAVIGSRWVEVLTEPEQVMWREGSSMVTCVRGINVWQLTERESAGRRPGRARRFRAMTNVSLGWLSLALQPPGTLSNERPIAQPVGGRSTCSFSITLHSWLYLPNTEMTLDLEANEVEVKVLTSLASVTATTGQRSAMKSLGPRCNE
jgi:hypothetical protein